MCELDYENKKSNYYDYLIREVKKNRHPIKIPISFDKKIIEEILDETDYFLLKSNLPEYYACIYLDIWHSCNNFLRRDK